MFIGVLTIDILIQGSSSLKEKRFVLQSIKDRVRKKYNVAVAELDYLDKWQRSRIGFVTIGNEQKFVEKSMNSVFNYLDNHADYEIITYEFEYI